ncbi:hypothetical protein ABFG93_22480 (plasmid) [Pseudalkalibacillus hwajinpoensis]|uniref:hypothetical protein n=1 Tax=Guptibacillus hwajinpoensis TaxID=208199 RepID=UPI00325B8F64
MKRLIIIIFLLAGCSDPSPLKSDIEVRYNELFGTEFGVIDQVYVDSNSNNLTVLGAEEFLDYLDGAKKVKGTESKTNIVITLVTSDGMKEYSKKQTSEQLSYDATKNMICNNDSCYTIPSPLKKLIDDLG